jgi:hypothetical protein
MRKWREVPYYLRVQCFNLFSRKNLHQWCFRGNIDKKMKKIRFRDLLWNFRILKLFFNKNTIFSQNIYKFPLFPYKISAWSPASSSESSTPLLKPSNLAFITLSPLNSGSFSIRNYFCQILWKNPTIKSDPKI